MGLALFDCFTANLSPLGALWSVLDILSNRLSVEAPSAAGSIGTTKYCRAVHSITLTGQEVSGYAI